MSEPARKSATNTRGRPFTPGNGGKPKGTRHKTTLAMEALLDGQAQALTQRAVELALAGDMQALRLCLERILPPRKDRPVTFDMPPIETAADAKAAMASLVAAAAAGEITAGEANEMAKVVEIYVKAIEVSDVIDRLDELEARGARA